MNLFKTFFLLVALVFSMSSYSETAKGDVSIVVGRDDTTLDKIRLPRMPQYGNAEPLKTSSGFVCISFEGDFANVCVSLYKDDKKVLCENCSEVTSETVLTYDLSIYGTGIYTIEVTIMDGFTVLKQIAYE